MIESMINAERWLNAHAGFINKPFVDVAIVCGVLFVILIHAIISKEGLKR